MGRYTGPSCRLCRREGERLFLKGDKCYGKSCAMNERAFPPGKLSKFRKKPTEYAIQLREKQKVKRYYGLMEKQFRRYFHLASKKKGITGVILLQILESRLDNVLYRAGFAPSRKSARQIIGHGHVQINGKRVDIPSYFVSSGETIEIVGKGKKMDLVLLAVESSQNKVVPEWIVVDTAALKATVQAVPERTEMNLEIEVNEQLIVELYSK